ncbi:MAG TPA: glycerophosphodiester phosphodiesterase family protein [Pyrinomonadaceae bacterium]|jgi:glycerophosphoryl diester phosphodiesterase
MKSAPEKPYIIAHRGASASAPENTIAAFRKAIVDGAEGIEFDVRLAKDGVPVVFHDATLSRVSSQRGLLSGYTSEELQKIDIGSWYSRLKSKTTSEDFSSETVPTLTQVLDFLKDFNGLIYIEIKCRTREIERISKNVCQIIGNSRLLPQIIIKSFQIEVVPTVRRILPNVQTAVLFAPKIMTILRKEKRLINIAHEVGADQVSIHYSLATNKLMKIAEKRNLPVTVWTIDNPRWIFRATEIGVTAVISNNPALLLAEKARKTESDKK